MSLKSALQKIQKIPVIQDQFNVFTHISKTVENQLVKDTEAIKPLSNLLCGIKDNIVTKNMPTTCASKILLDYNSPFNATVVDLLEESGAINVGKTNLDEFGMGSGGIHSHFGPTINPLFGNKRVVAGGSSSGSAAAVSAGVVDFAIGTDTGGSVRLPAAYTSVLGFKPSYGRISRFGVVAYAQSLDTVGILSQNIEILRKVYNVLNKYDSKDPTSLTEELRVEATNVYKKKEKLRVGIPKEFTQDNIPEVIKQGLLRVVDKLMSQGHGLYPVTLPAVKNSLPIYYTLAPAEAVSNLSRYDGIRYGTRDEKYDIANGTLFVPTRSNFGQEVQNRIVLGNYNLCSESFKNNYIRAQKLRVELIDQFDSIFSFPNVLTSSVRKETGVDVLLTLSSMNLPSTIENFSNKENSNPVNSYINDIFTTPMSLAGLPTISLPICGYDGVGIQLIGQYADDSTVLDIAEKLL